jgi:Ca-activated chloride channel homolog
MKPHKLAAASIGILSVLCTGPRLCAQASPDGQDHVISMEVKRVVLYATVREGKARFAGDLEQRSFTILEDGKPQNIISFSRDDVPVAIGLLIDNSQSMMNKRAEVVAAAKAFVRAAKQGDEMFVLHFNEQLTYGLPSDTPFTGDASLLDQALERTRLDGRTALYDAIHEGLKHLQTSKLTKRALIVISDGGDNMSVRKAAEVVKAADLSGALFYGIGIYDPMDGDANPGVLRKLAGSTGGEAYFPEGVAGVSSLCETIARDLRSQYMLSYAPPEVANGRDYRRIQVKVKDPKGRKLIVRTRTGYYATAEGTDKGKPQ